MPQEDERGVSIGGAFSLFEEMYDQRRAAVNKEFDKARRLGLLGLLGFRA